MFLKSVSLADQKLETTPHESWNLGFWSQCHLLIKRWRHHDDWKAETPKLRFLKSVSLADQKVETTPQWNLEIRFLKSLSLADQKVETPWLKGRDTQNLGFWSQCHLLIKRQRHHDQKETPKGRDTLIKKVKIPKQVFEVSITCWSKGGDSPLQWKLELRILKSVSLADQKIETPWLKGRDTQNLGFWSQCHLLINRWRQTPQWKLELRFLKSVSLAYQKVETSAKAAESVLCQGGDITTSTKLGLRFLRSVSLADQKVETTSSS